jgi:hypothetical protein
MFMKFVFMVILGFASQASAAPSRVVAQSVGRVGILGNLSCRIRLGTQFDEHGAKTARSSVELSEASIIPEIRDTQPPGRFLVELEHKKFVALGCNHARLAMLDQLVDESKMRFGFILKAPLELTKETSASRQNGLGECVATYQEHYTVEIAPGIILESNEEELRKATDCSVSAP